jgi:hypothetical protein
MIALALNLAIWFTHSFRGWLVLFLPGSALVLSGWRVILK